MVVAGTPEAGPHGWSAVGPAVGDALTVRLPGDTPKVVTGKFSGLDGEGALMLETETGQRRILAGDVLFATAYRQAEVI